MPHNTAAAGREAGRTVRSLSFEQGHLSPLSGLISFFHKQSMFHPDIKVELSMDVPLFNLFIPIYPIGLNDDASFQTIRLELGELLGTSFTYSHLGKKRIR
jgi:hypothetical protein